MAEIISSKSNKVRYKPFQIVGIGHIEETNESYLITIDDLKELEKLMEKDKKNVAKIRSIDDVSKLNLQTPAKIDEIESKMRKNPVNELAKEALPEDNIPSNFAKGFLSVGGYLYAFGDFAARYTGFRDYQECSSSVVEDLECSYEEDKVNQDIVFTKKLTNAIITNERGLGEVFVKSAKKYVTQNKTYFGGRMVGTNVLAARVTNKRVGIEPNMFGKKRNLKLNPAGLPISSLGSFMDALYYLRNVDTSVTIEEITPEIVDLYAKYIVLGQ